MTDRVMGQESAGQDEAAPGGFSAGYRRYALLMLMLIYMTNVVDRNILTILLQPIKLELALSDTQLGLLAGIAFALFYAIFGIPIAMLADRHNRVRLLATTLTIFSAMTILCGMVTNFLQIMVARILTAIGESATNPCSHSMISDMFPPQKRAFAVGFYSLGTNLGILIGFLVGGWISQWYGWRVAFFVVGTPGLLLALLVWLTLREPARGHADNLTAEGSKAAPNLLSVIKHLWSQRSFRHIILGVVALSLGVAAVNVWLPAFLSRSYGMQSGEIGSWLAFLFGVVGGTGTLLSGFVADKLGKRDIRWNVWMVAILKGLCFPFYVVIFLIDSKMAVMGLLVFPVIAFSAYLPPLIAMTQALAGVRMRAQATAVFFLFSSMLGAGLGPQIAGILSDYYEPAHGQESLRYALLTMTVVWLWSAVHLVLAGRTLRNDVDRIRQASSAN